MARICEMIVAIACDNSTLLVLVVSNPNPLLIFKKDEFEFLVLSVDW